ncbi:MAG: thioredoxin family protein [Candidatus Auribacterota bacterium]|nr:thioredoxin family protein [Candidatus Auribacterota bacterium]
MKRTLLLMTALFFVVLSLWQKGGLAVLQESKSIEIGTPIVDFNLKGTDGNHYTPASFADKDVVVLVVTCNHCPYSKAAWPLLIDLQNKFNDKGVQFVAINPNDEKGYPEDSFDNMKVYVEKYGINFPYLRDETQETARALKAVCTPDIYVYDGKRNLYYHGRINNNWQNPDKVTERNLEDALNGLLKGDPPPQDQPPSIGCSIKWLD